MSGVSDAVLIREMAPADRAALHGLIAALSAFEARAEADRNLAAAANAEYFDAIAAEIAEKGGFVLVADVGGEIVGYASVRFDDFGAYILDNLRRHAYVTDLFVAAHVRRRGVGRALATEAERRARAAGLKRMTIGALTHNALAHDSYVRWGFRSYAVEYIKDLV